MCSSLTDIMAQIRRTQAICLARTLMRLSDSPEALTVACRAAVDSFPEFDAESLVEMVQASVDRENDAATMDAVRAQVSRLNAPSMTYAKLMGAHA